MNNKTMTICEIIGFNLKTILKAQHISPDALAQKSGVSRSTIFRTLRGERMINKCNLEEICFALNIREVDLIRMG